MMGIAFRGMVGAVLLFLGMLLPSPRLEAQPVLSNEQIVDNLIEIVLGSEFIGEESDYVRKWAGQMRLAVYGDDEHRHDDLIDAHVEKLQKLTGIDIRRVSQHDPDQNAAVLFLSPAEFRKSARKYLVRGKPGLNTQLACFAYFRTNQAREILDFRAIIPSDASRSEVQACIIEELTQVLGLPNDSFKIAPSIFNDDDKFHHLTWQDELFLKVLYDPRVRPGMQRADFAAVARVAVAELRSQESAPAVALANAPTLASAEQQLETIMPAAGRSVSPTPRLTRDRDRQ